MTFMLDLNLTRLVALIPWASDFWIGDGNEPLCPICWGDLEVYDEAKHADYEEAAGPADYACEVCRSAWCQCDCFEHVDLGDGDVDL